jgi:hypothetical protein
MPCAKSAARAGEAAFYGFDRHSELSFDGGA